MKHALPALLGLALLWLTPGAGASYPPYQPAQQAHAPAAQQAKATINRFEILQLLQIPTYAAAYVPGLPVAASQYAAPAPQPAQAGATAAELREVLEVLRSLDARLRRLESQTPLPPVVPPAPPAEAAPPPMPKLQSRLQTPPGHSVLLNRCATCHEATAAQDRGSGIVLFKGDALTVGARWRQKMARLIDSGEMPPGGIRLTPAEKRAAREYLSEDKS